MTTPTPRWYLCEEAACPWAGRPRPVMPEHLPNGFVVWPTSIRCSCSPDGLDCRPVPAPAKVDLSPPRLGRPAPLADPVIGGSS